MKRSRESRYNQPHIIKEYDHDYPQTRTASRRSKDKPRKYSHDDIRILQDIVQLAVVQAESSADSGTPSRPNASFYHLHNAYEAILRLHDIEPASDSHFYRFLIKLAAEKAPSWKQRFQVLLDTINDDIESSSSGSFKIDDYDEGFSTSNQNESQDADDSSSADTMEQMSRYLKVRSPTDIAARERGHNLDDSDSADTLTILDRYLCVRSPTDPFGREPPRRNKTRKTPRANSSRTRTRSFRPNYFIPVDSVEVAADDVSTLPAYDDPNMAPMTVVHQSTPASATSRAVYLREWNSFILKPDRQKDKQTILADTFHVSKLVGRAFSAWREQLRWFYASQTYVTEARRNFTKERVIHAWRKALKRRRRKRHLVLVERQRQERDKQCAEAQLQQQLDEREEKRDQRRLEDYAERERLARLREERKQREQRERVEQEEQERLHRERIEREQRERIEREQRERWEREQREQLQQEEQERLYRERLQQEAQALEEQERQRDLARIQDLERERQQIESQRREALLTEQERQEQRRQQLLITAQIERERQQQERKEQEREYMAKVQAAKREQRQLDHASLAEGFQFWRLRTREESYTRAQDSILKQNSFRLWYLASWKSRSQVLYETKLCRGALREWRVRLLATVERNRKHDILLRFREDQALVTLFKAWRLRLILSDLEIRNGRRRLDEIWAHWRYTFVESRAINQHVQKQLVRNCLIRWRNHTIDVKARQEQAGVYARETIVFHAFALWKMMHQHQVLAQRFHDRRIQKDYLHVWLIYQRCQLLERVHWKRILRKILATWRQDAHQAKNASLRLEQWEQDHEQTESLQVVEVFKAWRRKAQVWVNATNYADKTARSSASRTAFKHWRGRLQTLKEAEDKVIKARNHFILVGALKKFRRKAVESRRAKIQRAIDKFHHVRNRRALKLTYGTWVLAKQRQRSLVEIEETVQNLITDRLRRSSMIKWKHAIDRHEQRRTIAIDHDDKRTVAAVFGCLVQANEERKKDHTLQIKVDSIHTLNKLKRHFNHWRNKWISLKALITKADNASRDHLMRTILAQFAERAKAANKLHKRGEFFINHRDTVAKVEKFITWHEKSSLYSRNMVRADRASGLKAVSNAFDFWKAKYAYKKVRERFISRTFLLAWRAIAQRRHALTVALDEASRVRYAFRDAKDAPATTIYKLKNMRAHFKAWRTRSQKIAHLTTLANGFTNGKKEKSDQVLKLRLFSQWHIAAIKKAAKTKEEKEKARLAKLSSAADAFKKRKNRSFMFEYWTVWRTRTRATLIDKFTSKHRAMILSSWTRLINEEAAIKRQKIQRDALRKWIEKTRRQRVINERGEKVFEGGVLRQALGVWRFHLNSRLKERGAVTYHRSMLLGKFFGKWKKYANMRVAKRLKKQEQYVKNEDLMRRYNKYRLLRMGMKRWQRQINAKRADRTRRSTRRFAPSAAPTPASLQTMANITIDTSFPSASIDNARRERLMRLNQQTVERRTARTQRRG